MATPKVSPRQPRLPFRGRPQQGVRRPPPNAAPYPHPMAGAELPADLPMPPMYPQPGAGQMPLPLQSPWDIGLGQRIPGAGSAPGIHMGSATPGAMIPAGPGQLPMPMPRAAGLAQPGAAAANPLSVIDAEVVSPGAPGWLKKLALGAALGGVGGAALYQSMQGEEEGAMPSMMPSHGAQPAPPPAPANAPSPTGRSAAMDPDRDLGMAMGQGAPMFEPDPELFRKLFQMDPLALQLAQQNQM